MKNKKSKLIVFVLAFIGAVFFFTRAVMIFIERDEGWQEVNAKPNEQVPLYASGYSLQYYVEGNSSQIRRTVELVSKFYSLNFSRIYKLLDPVNLYDGVGNIAALNAAQDGEKVKLDKDLFDILILAYEQTLQRKGFNMFAGALYSEWDSILYSLNPEDFDPKYNDYEAQRIELLAQAVNDYSNFSFQITDADQCEVCFIVFERYKELMEELEIDSPVIDLNVLAPAYALFLFCKALKEENMDMAQMFCRDGYAFSIPSGKASAVFTGEVFDVRTGSFHNVLADASVTGNSDELPALAYLLLQLNCCENEEEVRALCSDYDQYEISVSCKML